MVGLLLPAIERNTYVLASYLREHLVQDDRACYGASLYGWTTRCWKHLPVWFCPAKHGVDDAFPNRGATMSDRSHTVE